MEAEERPTKLRKLSHDRPRSAVSSNNPDSGNSSVASKLHGSSEVPTNDADIANPYDTTFTATKLATTSAAILSELPTPDTTADTSNNTSTTSGLSKNQLKKIKRKAEWEAGREDRKARRRAKDKEKKLRRRAERDGAKANAIQKGNGEQDDLGDSDGHRNGTQKRTIIPQKPQKWQLRQNRIRLPISFVLDCSFDKLMTDGEIISLGSQLTRCYSDNTKAPHACHFYISSWKPETELRKRFEGLMRGMYRNWKGVVFTEEDFVEAGKLAHSAMTGPSGGKMAGMFAKYQDSTESTTNNPDENTTTPILTNDPTTATTTTTTISPNPSSSSLPTPTNPQIIYLTSDSPHTLSTLNPYTTYIIGGLVDKNRHKSICYNTAVARGIPTAKLPLAEYMQMTSRQVLTTNHVVEIMLRWLEVGDWGDAFLSVLPKRKGAVLKGTEDGRGGSNRDESASESGGEGDYSEGEGNGDGEYGDDSDIDINVTKDRKATKPENEAGI